MTSRGRPPGLQKWSRPSADPRPARLRRSRTAAGWGPTFRGGSQASGRWGLVLGTPRSLVGRKPAWPRRSRASGGKSSALRWGSRISGRRCPVLGPPRSCVDRTPTRPQGSSAVWQGGSQPSRKWAAHPSGPQGSSRRSPGRLGVSRGLAASSLPGCAAPAFGSGGGTGPAPAQPGFAGGGLEGLP